MLREERLEPLSCEHVLCLGARGTLDNPVYVKWDAVLVISALTGISLCASHSAGVQGCSQSVAGQPSAAAIRAYIVAPSIDSRMMSA